MKRCLCPLHFVLKHQKSEGRVLGTDTEIRTFAIIYNTTVYVYCSHGVIGEQQTNYV